MNERIILLDFRNEKKLFVFFFFVFLLPTFVRSRETCRLAFEFIGDRSQFLPQKTSFFFLLPVSDRRRAQCWRYILHYTSEHANKRQRLHVGGHVQWTSPCRARQPGTVLHRPRRKALPSHSHLPPPWQAATARHGIGCSGRGWVLPGDRVSGLVQDARCCCHEGTQHCRQPGRATTWWPCFDDRNHWTAGQAEHLGEPRLCARTWHWWQTNQLVEGGVHRQWLSAWWSVKDESLSGFTACSWKIAQHLRVPEIQRLLLRWRRGRSPMHCWWVRHTNSESSCVLWWCGQPSRVCGAGSVAIQPSCQQRQSWFGKYSKQGSLRQGNCVRVQGMPKGSLSFLLSFPFPCDTKLTQSLPGVFCSRNWVGGLLPPSRTFLFDPAESSYCQTIMSTRPGMNMKEKALSVLHSGHPK